MASFDLRNPADRAVLGMAEDWNPDGTVLKPFHVGDRWHKYMSRAEVKALMLAMVRVAPRPMTRLEIARSVGKAKSPHSIAMIMELVSSGDLTETAHVLPNGLTEYLYTWGG